jgi:hypothetical protein
VFSIDPDGITKFSAKKVRTKSPTTNTEQIPLRLSSIVSSELVVSAFLSSEEMGIPLWWVALANKEIVNELGVLSSVTY